MKENEIDIWEDAYEIAKEQRYLDRMKARIVEKAKERGITETQLWGIQAAMKVRVDEEFREMYNGNGDANADN